MIINYMNDMKTIGKILGAVTVALGLSSCSQFTLVNSEVYNNADLADYKTFRIVTPEDGHLPPGMEMVTYYNIAAAIREQMVDRGFTENAESPMLINIGLTVKRELETAPVSTLATTLPPAPPPAPAPPFPGLVIRPFLPTFIMPRGAYWGLYPTATVVTGVYREGVLTMDFVDIPKKLPLYSASVATIMENGNAQFRNLQGIAQAVQTLFSRFPVPLLPQYRK
jgi:hypothetical protein